MKLISLNVELNKHLDVILPFIKKEKPDVFCTQEILEENVSLIAEVLGCEAIFQATSYVSHHYYPTQHGKRFGVAIFAQKIKASGSIFYVGSATPAQLPFEEYIKDKTNDEHTNKAVVWVKIIDENDTTYTFATTHLPVTREGISTPAQIAATENLIRTLKEIGEVVLVGDMNAPRGNETFSLLATEYEDAIPKNYTTSLDQNLHRVPGLQYMVDGLFLSASYAASGVKLQDGLSDHMAVIATISKK